MGVGRRLAQSAGLPDDLGGRAGRAPELYDWFVSQRRGIGLTILPLGAEAGGVLLRTLRGGGLVGLLCDRDIVGNGVEVEFFGERTTLPAGPATLALRTGATLLPTAVYGGPGRHHTAVIMPPVEAVRSGRFRADVTRLTQQVARDLETLIRRAPDQWYLFQPNWPSDHLAADPETTGAEATPSAASDGDIDETHVQRRPRLSLQPDRARRCPGPGARSGPGSRDRRSPHRGPGPGRRTGGPPRPLTASGSTVVALGRSRPVSANGSVAPISVDPVAAGRALRYIRDAGVDVVHLHEPLAPGAGYACLLRCRQPLIGTFHRAGASAAYRWIGPARPLGRRSSRRPLRGVARGQGDGQRRARGGATRSWATAWSPIVLPAPIPWPTEGPTLLFVGRHERRKGLAVLLDAFEGDRGRQLAATLWVVGQGPETDCVAGPGGVRRPRGVARARRRRQLASRLGGAHILCAPSLGGESFGMVLLEAMAARTAVVASDIPGYAFVAGGHALLVPPGDTRALTEALWRAVVDAHGGVGVCSPAALDSAFSHASTWSMARLAERYAGIYDAQLRASSAGRLNWARTLRRCPIPPARPRVPPRAAVVAAGLPRRGAHTPEGPLDEAAVPGTPGPAAGRVRGRPVVGHRETTLAAAVAVAVAAAVAGDRAAGDGAGRDREDRTDLAVEAMVDRRARSSLPVVAEPVVTAEPESTRAEEAVLARRNRRRGLAIAALPGIIVGIVVAVVCLVLVAPVVAVVAGVVIGIVAWVGTWWGAMPALVRALQAEPADEDDYARVFNQVEGLCATMGLALPTVCVVEDDDVLDALVLGRRRRVAVLVVTSGLADALDPVQLEAVLAHELVHVKCADIVPATMAAAVALPLVAVVPGLADLVHALAGRGREFRTDQMAVSVTRYPPGLREALALMVEGPLPRSPSPLAGRGVAQVTRWLWTVSLADATGQRRSQGGAAGDLDAAAVRIAALDEW